MFIWQVTKYDPDYYMDGRYQPDEWFLFRHIGKKFYDGLLTKEKYLAVEDAYAEACRYFLSSYDKPIYITRLEDPDPDTIECFEDRLKRPNRRFKNFEPIYLDAAEDFCRLVLRGEVWGLLIVEGEGFVQFGHDYYMHVGFYEDHFFEIEDLFENKRLHKRDTTYEFMFSDQFSAAISLVEGRDWDPDQTELVEPRQRWPKED